MPGDLPSSTHSIDACIKYDQYKAISPRFCLSAQIYCNQIQEQSPGTNAVLVAKLCSAGHSPFGFGVTCTFLPPLDRDLKLACKGSLPAGLAIHCRLQLLKAVVLGFKRGCLRQVWVRKPWDGPNTGRAIIAGKQPKSSTPRLHCSKRICLWKAVCILEGGFSLYGGH